MGKKKKDKKEKKEIKRAAKARSGSDALADKPVDEARVAAYGRLWEPEEVLYKLWEQRTDGEMDWIGEVLRAPVDEESTLWLAALGDKVAALGGQLELIAVFPDKTVTLLREPGLNSALAPEDEP